MSKADLKMGDQEESLHRIRITLTSTNMKSLEKVQFFTFRSKFWSKSTKIDIFKPKSQIKRGSDEKTLCLILSEFPYGEDSFPLISWATTLADKNAIMIWQQVFIIPNRNDHQNLCRWREPIMLYLSKFPYNADKSFHLFPETHGFVGS